MKHFLSFSNILIGIAFTLSACQKTTDNNYTIPTTYNFDNTNYTDQTTSINMHKELVAYAKSANIPGAAAISSTKIINMYNNNNAPFSTLDLNSTTKNLKEKTITTAQNDFEAYMSALAIESQHTNKTATSWQAGILVSNDGSNSYLFNKNGVELAQIIEKGLVSACFYYQGTTVNLSETKMNSDNKAVIAGKGTNMEHYWDESFGYFGAPIDFPSNTSNLESWAVYANEMNAVLGCNSKIMNAYLKGRAAISAKDYDTRDAMRTSIKQDWEILLAAVGISYLNKAKDNQNDLALYCHHLTEAYAIIMGLKYGASQQLSETELSAILNNLAGSADPLQANFHNTSVAQINNAIDAISSTFTSLENIKASL